MKESYNKNNTCYICKKIIQISKIAAHIEECKTKHQNITKNNKNDKDKYSNNDKKFNDNFSKFADSPFKKIDTCIINKTPNTNKNVILKSDEIITLVSSRELTPNHNNLNFEIEDVLESVATFGKKNNLKELMSERQPNRENFISIEKEGKERKEGKEGTNKELKTKGNRRHISLNDNNNDNTNDNNNNKTSERYIIFKIY